MAPEEIARIERDSPFVKRGIFKSGTKEEAKHD